MTIALNNASEEVAKYECSDRDLILRDGKKVNVTDERRHDRATMRLDNLHYPDDLVI